MSGSSQAGPAIPSGGFLNLDGEIFYRIRAFDRLPGFLMSIASDSDLWMFITSRGGLTAGRVDAEGALFPYETVDKLLDGHHHTGPITLLRVRSGTGPETLWQPFTEADVAEARTERNLYKNVLGNRLIFEEVRHDLGLEFRCRWSACDELGWVRSATLTNRGDSRLSIDCLDGLRNVLPFGAPLALYQQSSSLVDAYKRTDRDPDTSLAIFSLTAKITDRAEAAEELRANTVWRHGGDFRLGLSRDAIAAFREGRVIPEESVLTGCRGNYLAASSFELDPGAASTWHVVADAGRSHVQVAAIREWLVGGADPGARIVDGLANASENLARNVASADGLQTGGHAEACAHHSANVLFNNMRGGVFADNHDVPARDFADFVATRNRAAAARHRALLDGLPERIPVRELHEMAAARNDADLERLAHEYLPIHFGRRHGDPSRPWNRFAIRVRNPDGSRALRYEGNWRDIFQNWEALAASFPRFLPGMIAKFVNASTVDGFNPYRITRDGVDWEVEDPKDPWSYIGYWGDHQIVYLLRLLEALERCDPGALEARLEREIFAYAEVPYRLKPYGEIVESPRATIAFEAELHAAIAERVRTVGTDGKLVTAADGAVLHVNLMEKLLVPALSKLSNLVPGGGIWMNTQRPEWNDANNALVGNGVSMVTLAYLRRYLRFLGELAARGGPREVRISAEVAAWFREIRDILAGNRTLFAEPDDGARKRLLDALGNAFGDYRAAVYARGFSGRDTLSASEVSAFCREAADVLDDVIRSNRREDGLYHSYNLLEWSGDGAGVSVRRLPEMLEGQVAVLSSGMLTPEESIQVVSRMFESRLYREDQRSFLLYPARELPGFLEKNVIPEERLTSVPLLRQLLEAGDTSIVARDAQGVGRFQGDFSNALDVAAALDRLAASPRWAKGVAADRQAVLDVFEAVFDHHAFTGRSGTMYGYEGLGCIYWHMVAKLLLAVQEIAQRAPCDGSDGSIRKALIAQYYRVRHGLGFEKSVTEYGAFPTDPYSHTPAHAGAQQPGMTGQVKEEILTRFGELGVHVEKGRVAFRPFLLHSRELPVDPLRFDYFDVAGRARSMPVPAVSLAFTFCQVPVRYEFTEGQPWLRVTDASGRSFDVAGDTLDLDLSRSLLDRSGEIQRIEVGILASSVCAPRVQSV